LPKFVDLLPIFGVSRPNGSYALDVTRKRICHWLGEQLPYQLHTFSLFPYYSELLGVWVASSQLLLVWAVWQRWGWGLSLIGIISLVVIWLEVNGRYTITRLFCTQGYNIILPFPSATQPRQQAILSAHYDSKTELLDQQNRKIFVAYVPLGLLIILGLSIYGLCQSAASAPVQTAVLIIAILHWGMMTGLALNSLLGRFVSPSLGAVDNGGSCAVLLHLAQQFPTLQQTNVTIALFVGEEIWLQGSRAFAANHTFALPTVVLNLEGMGQNGRYYLTTKIGLPLLQELPTDNTLNARVTAVAEAVSGQPVEMLAEVMMTDTFPFLKQGIPATTLGTYDQELKLSGLHRPTDNLSRIHESNLTQAVEILQRFLWHYDQE